MTTPKTKYAVDLSNDGMSLWHRDAGRAWKLLGKVALNTENFSAEIERLKNEQATNSDGNLIAQVRIPDSEVFVSDIDLDGAKGAEITPAVNAFLAKHTPYASHDLVFDLANKPSEDKTYVAAITKETMAEARDFIADYGFEAAYYTTKLDKNDFPRNPRFYDAKKPAAVTEPSVKPENPSPVKTTPKADVTGKETPALNGLSAEKPDTLHAGKPSLDAPDKENSTGFKNVRNKAQVVSGQSDGETTDIPAKLIVPDPPRRISVDISAPKTKAIRQTPVPASNPIKTPQGDATQTDVRGLFKLRNTLLFTTLVLVALLYWFYTALFDGKEEIARLQQIPATAPAIIAEPAPLLYRSSIDTTPSLGQDILTRVGQSPSLKIPEAVSEPTPVATVNLPLYGVVVPGKADMDVETVITVPPVVQATEPDQTVLPAASTRTPTENPDTIAPTLILTKEGVAGPEGITLFLGQPDILPPRREQLKISPDPLKDILPQMRSKIFEENNKSETPLASAVQVTAGDVITDPDPMETAPADAPQVIEPDILALADPSLQNILPRPRPAAIPQQAKDLKNSLLILADPTLAGLKPRRRPARLGVPPEVTVLTNGDQGAIETAIQQAVNEQVARPRARPANLSRTVAKVKANGDIIQTAALSAASIAVTSKASGASPVNIQEEATERRRFNKKRISLIGVFGTASSRRALVRMPSGRFITVKPGQKFSGWRVAAIGESSMQITKGSRNQVLRMPR